jgi:hypothetical protein
MPSTPPILEPPLKSRPALTRRRYGLVRGGDAAAAKAVDEEKYRSSERDGGSGLALDCEACGEGGESVCASEALSPGRDKGCGAYVRISEEEEDEDEDEDEEDDDEEEDAA